MKCGFCGRDIPDEVPENQTGCGMCHGGCRKVHCPNCGYANPLVPSYLKRLKKKIKPEE
ncbi:MAG TPA: hypothetical protein VJ955_07515 [Desulfuromonadales bacterium]|nr:hypothetical protein [Desulfuromonadales bacterium]